MHIEEHVPLKELTTLKIGGAARYFAAVSSVEELREAVRFAREKQIPFIVLGGGSNVLVSEGELQVFVIKNEIRGVEWGEENQFPISPPAPRLRRAGNFQFPRKNGIIYVVVGAGESWDGLVGQAVKRGLWGIENLSGIPGTVGAAPVQNIGAYGAEIENVLEWVEVFDSTTGKVRQLGSRDCFFGYRDSIFKMPEGKGLIISRVALRLSQNGRPNLEYKDLQSYFAGSYSPLTKGALPSPAYAEASAGRSAGGLLLPSLSAIRSAVLDIRSKKFPDLTVYGTAGSFFKNPIVSHNQFDALKKKFPDLPGFPFSYSPLSKGALPSSAGRMSDSFVKIPLAWVLDNICNLKGKIAGKVGSFKNQPIVLVNFGGASFGEVHAFAKRVIDCVKEKTGIDVEYEVQTIE